MGHLRWAYNGSRMEHTRLFDDKHQRRLHYFGRCIRAARDTRRKNGSKSPDNLAKEKGKKSKSLDTSAKGKRNRQKKVPQPSGHTYHPPFTLTMANMITNLGVEGPASKKPVSPEEAKGATYAERRIDEVSRSCQ